MGWMVLAGWTILVCAMDYPSAFDYPTALDYPSAFEFPTGLYCSTCLDYFNALDHISPFGYPNPLIILMPHVILSFSKFRSRHIPDYWSESLFRKQVCVLLFYYVAYSNVQRLKKYLRMVAQANSSGWRSRGPSFVLNFDAYGFFKNQV